MLVTLVVLAAILIIAGEISSSKGPVSAVNPGTRAVVVPTDDASRTVIVEPCGTGTSVASTNPTTALNTPGAIGVSFPQGQGPRIVVIPKCTATHGGATPANYFPAAAFVLGQGTSPPPIGTGKSISASSSSAAGAPQSAQYQVSVPVGTPVKTIVVTPCQQSKATGPAEQILGATSGSTTAVAPAC